jgi:hypothetical protein
METARINILNLLRKVQTEVAGQHCFEPNFLYIESVLEKQTHLAVVSLLSPKRSVRAGYF